MVKSLTTAKSKGKDVSLEWELKTSKIYIIISAIEVMRKKVNGEKEDIGHDNGKVENLIYPSANKAFDRRFSAAFVANKYQVSAINYLFICH